ncbi:hypothetical protein FRACYDRAFT_247466 [Fragilariopsis cylindrus CCMP1102]|uniref:Uncharacterized protein n=1 Tax=Fragilariopsis cylindrus CCMP1102 TaxID=635003 RepID=A0A1E7EX16_9STRA|nr:hypothetical protein FRACYDRAFT_247466 [Fragilariopsis cylindrus CCMP1102]|eukprot:OEU10397.1 hypothetical protein FRACYDRAFT_247466 [Fragilariopsis cylindrus CCMP1102]
MISERDHGDGNYQGLDSDRDTKAEFETVLRLFPSVLTRRIEVEIDAGDDEEGQVQLVTCRYPIRFLALTAKAVSFLPLVAGLAIELGLFDEQQRGGLLCLVSRGNIVLHHLMMTDLHESQKYHEIVDDKKLQVLIQLRKLGLLKKEDIKSYGLLSYLCQQNNYFAEKRIRFLVEWDPSALLHPDQRDVPLHYAIGGCPSPVIQRIQFVFEYGIHYFPKKKGISLLFKKNNHNRTPFQYACMRFGGEKQAGLLNNC